MKDLGEIRKRIDEIDSNLLRLFTERIQIASDVAAAKREKGLPVLDPSRERAILTKVGQAVGPDLENEARILYTTLFAISRGRQRAELIGGSSLPKMIDDAIANTPDSFPSMATVACPGAEGSYSQQATCRFFKTPTITYFRGFEGVFEAVERGDCEYGVLPVENSAAGSVTAVYDLMAKHDFRIVRELRLRIQHVLLAAPGVKLEDVREVSSHPHALAQCKEFLGRHSEFKVVPSTNTAAAAEALAKSKSRDTAVIASRACAELYGLNVIADGISDVSQNYTRFICISKRTEIYHDANKISLMMTLPHRPCALSDLLVKFAAIGVNLTKLESRPMPGSDFEFRFIFDFDASPRDRKVQKLLAGIELDPEIEHFTFLGSYAGK